MSDQPLFQNIDEEERIYAPQELPEGDPAEARAHLEGGHPAALTPEPPAAAPVANLGTAAMAPPNIGHGSRNEAPGAPDPVARDPLESDPE